MFDRVAQCELYGDNLTSAGARFIFRNERHRHGTTAVMQFSRKTDGGLSSFHERAANLGRGRLFFLVFIETPAITRLILDNPVESCRLGKNRGP